jgi:SsrA-binding protein
VAVSRERGRKVIAQNKKARHDYFIEDTYEAGLVLTGTEVKSLRAGRASLVDGFVMLRDGEAFLHAVHIPEYVQGTWTNHEPRRVRKLLLNRAEIDRWSQKTRESGLTIVPLALYFKDGRDGSDDDGWDPNDWDSDDDWDPSDPDGPWSRER